MKTKYWYRTDIYSCVICGAETKCKSRVYDEKLKGVNWIDKACDNHF